MSIRYPSITSVLTFLGLTGSSTQVSRTNPLPVGLERSGLTHNNTNGTAIVASGNTTVQAAPAASNKLLVYRVHITNESTTVDTTVAIRSGAAGALHYPTLLTAKGTISIDLEGGFETVGGGTPEALILNISDAAEIQYTIDTKTVAG